MLRFHRRRFAPRRDPGRRPQRALAAAAAAPRAPRARAGSARIGMFGNPRVAEVKSVDTVVPTSDLANIAAVVGAEPATIPFTGLTELNQIFKGTDFYERIGSKINMRSIHVTFNVQFTKETEGGAPYPLVFRYLIIYDRQTNGAFPLIGDILNANVAAGTLDLGFYDSIFIPNKDRFSILRDKYFTVDDVNTSIVPVSEYIAGNFETTFKSSDGDIGDINTGAVYFICFQNVTPGAGVTGHLTLRNFLSRIRYND